ncbi:MAG: ComEA family DNA-binding protein [Bacteroidia bacterium]
MNYLNNAQKRGLILLLLLGICINFLMKIWSVNADLFGNQSFANTHQSPMPFEARHFEKYGNYARKDPKPLDINTADTTAWQQLPGIGKVLSKRIVKFREMLGGFMEVAQVQKVYGLKPETYEKILPYLQINPETIPPTASQSAQRKWDKGVQTMGVELSIIDINEATEEDWESLPGIGEVLSKRIIKYRTAIGGFKNVEQVAKLYGLPPETFEEIKPYLKFSKLPIAPEIDPSTVAKQEKMPKTEVNSPSPSPFSPNAPSAAGPKAQAVAVDINQADSLQLFALPGIGEKLAGKIVKYRKNIGFFAKPEYVKAVYGFSEENFAKAQPFLKMMNLPNSPKKNFNKLAWTELIKYPTMNKELTTTVINFRKLNGYFKTWDEVKNIEGVTNEQIEMFKLYFEL